MPRFVVREEWLAGIKGRQTNSGDAGVWRTQSYAPLKQPDLQGMAIHWPGGNGNFSPALADPFKYVQDMQIQYRNGHQFDLGYSFVITPDGTVFEVRGMQYRPASQDEPGNTIDENGIANSILLACDLDGKYTLAQRDSARWVIQTQRAFWNKPGLWIKGHREIGNNSTVCPGDKIVADIHAGVFEPPPAPLPSPEVPMTPEDKAYLDSKFAALNTSVPSAVWHSVFGSLGTLGGGEAWIVIQDARAFTRNTYTAVQNLTTTVNGMNAKLDLLVSALQNAGSDPEIAQIVAAVKQALTDVVNQTKLLVSPPSV